MTKSFPLHVPGKDDKRVLELIKIQLTKYVKRERRKTLPPEVHFWDFQCKVGSKQEKAVALALTEVPQAVEVIAQGEGEEVYVEIMVCPGIWTKKTETANSQGREP